MDEASEHRKKRKEVGGWGWAWGYWVTRRSIHTVSGSAAVDAQGQECKRLASKKAQGRAARGFEKARGGRGGGEGSITRVHSVPGGEGEGQDLIKGGHSWKDLAL